MASKLAIFAVMVVLSVSSCLAGVLPVSPVAAAYVAPYATSYNAHIVNHAVAAPIAAPLVAAPVAAAPLVAAAPAHFTAAYPYNPYTAPLVLG